MSMLLNNIHSLIETNFGSVYPGDGPICINKDGTFINLNPPYKDHKDLVTWLIEQKIPIDLNIDAFDYIVNTLEYVRCRNSVSLTFLDLPNKLTVEQYDSISVWFDTKVCSKTIDINIKDFHKTVYTDEYDSKDIIKIIKRNSLN